MADALRYRVTYFTATGAHYGEAFFEYRADASMLSVASHLRGLRDGGGPGALPGFEGRFDAFGGYMLLEAVPSVGRAPRLIPPAWAEGKNRPKGAKPV